MTFHNRKNKKKQVQIANQKKEVTVIFPQESGKPFDTSTGA
jgi:hypothetical protein